MIQDITPVTASVEACHDVDKTYFYAIRKKRLSIYCYLRISPVGERKAGYFYVTGNDDRRL